MVTDLPLAADHASSIILLPFDPLAERPQVIPLKLGEQGNFFELFYQFVGHIHPPS